MIYELLEWHDLLLLVLLLLLEYTGIICTYPGWKIFTQSFILPKLLFKKY